MATPAKSGAKKKTSGQSAARQWKRAKGEEVEVPSGNVALLKRPGMEAFLAEGLIPDALMPIVQESIRTGQGLPPEKMAEMSEDLTVVGSMLDAMDRVVVRVVIEPKVLWHKRIVVDGEGAPVLKDGKEQTEVIPESERDDDLLYTDDVDMEDKTFIFNYAVGGTRDLERFREEASASLVAVQDVKAVRNKAK